MNQSTQVAAADWLARRNGGLVPAEEAALAAWLAQDPRHAAEFAALEQTWATLNAPRVDGCADAAWHEIVRLRRGRVRRRRLATFGLGIAACLALGSRLFVRDRVGPADASPPVVAAVRPAIRTLTDGSKVALRDGAEIDFEFTATLRRVRLLRGEALFTVAKDPARPFIVAAGGMEVRAVGTEFAVAHGSGEITVLVTEGRIAVACAAIDPEPRFAQAGERVTVTAASAPAVATAPPAEIAAALRWRGIRLEFTDTPLGEAVLQFNRAGGLQLVVDDPAAARRRITGVFWADDADALVRLFESGFDLTAVREGQAVRLNSRR